MGINKWAKNWAEKRPLSYGYVDQVESTNDWAKDNFSNDFTTPFKVYFTSHQTAGRGRFERTWSDGDLDETLLSSWSFSLTQPPQPILTPLVGLALYKAACETWPAIKFAIKAPNDLYVGPKKVGGLLLETIAQGLNYRVIVGLGLNVLGHPKIDQSGSIAESIPTGHIPENEFNIFLENWFWRLKAALQDGVLLAMTKSDCKELKNALNQWSLLEKPYDEVFSNGSLKAGSSVVNWNEI